MERLSYIEDSPGRFRDSCVRYVEFASVDMRQFFARRREREDILIRELKGRKDVYYKLFELFKERVGEDLTRAFESAVALREVERELIWMVAGGNTSTHEDALEAARNRSRRGKSRPAAGQLALFTLDGPPAIELRQASMPAVDRKKFNLQIGGA